MFVGLVISITYIVVGFNIIGLNFVVGLSLSLRELLS